MTRRTNALLLTTICLALAAGCSDEAPAGSGQATCADGEEFVNGSCLPVRDRDVGLLDVTTEVDSGLEDTTVLDTTQTFDIPEEVEPDCIAPDVFCFDDTTVAECNALGEYDFVDCPEGDECTEGICETPVVTCEPGEVQGCLDATTASVCAEDGSAYEPVACPEGMPNCLFALRECTSQICVTGSRRCGEGDVDFVEICNQTGTEWVELSTCDLGTLCIDGACESPCDANSKVPSFLGCDYWAVDLDNLEQACDLSADGCDLGETCNEETNVCEPSAAGQQFAVAISNPNSQDVTITVIRVTDDRQEIFTVGANTSLQVELDRLDVNGSGLSRNAYRIETSLPITAHQFNPANNSGVFSNDASLLFPSNVGGLEYIVMNWPTGPYGTAAVEIGEPGNQGAFAYVTIVAVYEDGTTNITVDPTVDIMAGDGVDAIAGLDDTGDFVLEYGDVLNLQTDGAMGLDLTGTRILADNPILVYVGHECAFVPDEPINPYCDHIEQQLFPVEAWGTEYLATKFNPRGTEADVWRVVAAADETLLRTDPVIAGVSGETLDLGDVLEFQSTESFLISGNNPILVGQFMIGSDDVNIESTCPANFGDCETATDCPTIGNRNIQARVACNGGQCQLGCARENECNVPGIGGSTLSCGAASVCTFGGVGDPAMVLAVPTAQFRQDYVFLTPGDYRDDFVTVVAPDGAAVTIDDTPISSDLFTPIGASGFSMAYVDTSIPTEATPHVIQSTDGSSIGLSVYGYDCDVSYAYPGGLNLSVRD